MGDRVVHFEIHADDLARAKQFYEKVFGWKFTQYGGPQDYWLISTGDAGQPGIDGGLLKRTGPTPGAENPVSAFVCTVGVASVDKTLEAATKAGARVAMPKGAIPGMGWLAYILDTEGNTIGMMETDPNAK